MRASRQSQSELKAIVRTVIGPFATPDFIQFAPGLPKTRSGKIMRRILRKIAAYKEEDIGDVSTLAEPHVIDVRHAAVLLATQQPQALLEHRPPRPDAPEDEYG